MSTWRKKSKTLWVYNQELIKTVDILQDTWLEGFLWWSWHNVPNQASRTTEKWQQETNCMSPEMNATSPRQALHKVVSS